MSQIGSENCISFHSPSFASQAGSLAEISLLSTQDESEIEEEIVSPQTRGWINKHYSLILIGNKKMRKCLAQGCGKRYAAQSSTRVFKGHWREKHSTLHSPRKTRFMFHNCLHINRLVKLFISRHLDYSLVDHQEFKDFAEALNPNRQLVCRQTIAELINRGRVNLTSKISEKLEECESVALTFDIWSARKGSRGFGCVTAHYISSKGAMENIIVHFKRMKFPHDAETIKKFIEKPINVHNLRGKIVAITTDNASNNTAAIKMMDKSLGLTSLNLEFVHYKCVAHILDLGMKDALKQLSDTVKPVRDAVMAIRSSRKRKEKFFDKQRELIESGNQMTKQPLELAEDVDHRWNSAFVLLERALLLRDAIDDMITTTKGLESIPLIDWPTIEKIVQFLEPFYEATRLLCRASDVTISTVSYIVPRLIEHCSTIENCVHERIAAAAKSLRSKLTDYELELYRPVADIAYLLDPRYKTRNLSEEHRSLVIKRVSKLIDEIPQPVDDRLISSRRTILNHDSDTDDLVDELTSYIDSRRIKIDSDVAKWWQINSEFYPKLAAIARKILPIQATSVASERVFSIAGDVDTKNRNRLMDESVENIVLLKSWIQFLNVE